MVQSSAWFKPQTYQKLASRPPTGDWAVDDRFSRAGGESVSSPGPTPTAAVWGLGGVSAGGSCCRLKTFLLVWLFSLRWLLSLCCCCGAFLRCRFPSNLFCKLQRFEGGFEVCFLSARFQSALEDRLGKERFSKYLSVSQGCFSFFR